MCVSSVSPKILGVLLSRMVVLLSVTLGCLCDSFVSDVKSVIEDLCGETVTLLILSHCSNCRM